MQELFNEFVYQEWIGDAVFLLFVLITLVGAVMAVSLKNIFHNALSLALALVGTAGIFVFLHAEFLALMQVLIYAGAISIAIIFAIMLSPPLALVPEKRNRRKIFISTLAGTFVFCVLSYLMLKTPWPVSPDSDGGDYSIVHLGEMLLGRYAFAFELISVVLLAAILGALVIARGGEEEKTNDL